jgi:hypothetical protein
MTPLHVQSSKWPGPWLVVNATGIVLFAVGSYFALPHRRADLLLWAVLPLSWTVALIVRHPWSFGMTLDDNGIQVSDGRSIPYAALRGLSIPPHASRRRSFPIGVALENDVLQIPARLDVPSGAVFQPLRQRLPTGSTDEIPDSLVDFCHQQIDTFGRERVWNCSGRSPLGNFRRGGLLTFAIGVMLTAIVWVIVASLNRRFEAWLVGSGIFFTSSLVLLVAALVSRDRVERRWADKANAHGIVIGPIGMGIAQLDLLGQVEWHEIQRVVFPTKPRSFAWGDTNAQAVGAIAIRVAGAELIIFDVYDRALAEIHGQIMRNWRPLASPVGSPTVGPPMIGPPI